MNKKKISSFLSKNAFEETTSILNALMQDSPIGFVYFDKKLQYKMINQALADINGYSISYHLGKTLGEVLPQLEAVGKKIAKTILKTHKPYTTEVAATMHYQPNETRYFREDWYPVYAEKQIIGFCATAIDITEKKKAEDRLQKAVTTRDDFISMASHELKTPLTSMSVFTQVLRKRFKTTKDTESLKIMEKMEKNIRKLTLLVKDLLDVSRIERGKLQIVKETFLIKDLVLDIVEDLQPITTHKLILDWHTKLYVCGDKERIRQVLVNLITNAIKYSPTANKVIISSTKKNSNIEISVQDFGMGISKGEQQKFFDRFYQSQKHKTYPGLGLGLYISQRIITAHGGKLWVESKEGKGSIFHFTLPTIKKK
jgi:PAS domain S-box-containing protein